MSKTDTRCAFHLPIMSAAALFLNLAMLVQVIRRRKKDGGYSLLYGCLSASNLLWILAAFLSPAVSERDTQGMNDFNLLLYTVTLRSVKVCSNCGFNLAIAYCKMCVVTQPFKYFNAMALKRLSKKAALTVVVATAVISLLVTFGTALSKKLNIVIWAVTIVLIVTSISLCFVYGKLFVENRKKNNEMIQEFDVQEDRDIIMKRKSHERYLRRLFIGITSNFFVLNLPAIVITKISSPLEFSPCNSTEGSLKVFMFTCSMLDMLFDPFWFFYMLWRMTKNQQHNVLPQNEVKFSPYSSRNETAIISHQNEEKVLSENSRNETAIMSHQNEEKVLSENSRNETAIMSHQNEEKVLSENSRNETAIMSHQNEMNILQRNNMKGTPIEDIMGVEEGTDETRF